MELRVLTNSLQNQIEATCAEITSLNAHTEHHGLKLTEKDATELVIQQRTTLQELRRIEFGKGPLEELVKTFASSPFLEQNTYAETLGGLQDAFYHIKESTNNEIPDNDLIDAMRILFDSKAGGSLTYFEDVSAETIKQTLEDSRRDDNADWSEFEIHENKEQTTDEPDTSDITSRVKEADQLERPSNEFAAGFYDEYFDLYRSSFDFNSRIGGSSL